MRKVLIIGATSAIAEATARLFAEAGYALYLVARNEAKLQAIASDLKVRGASAAHLQLLDVLDYDRHKAVVDAAVEALDGLDMVLIAHGTLPDQKACERSFDLARKEIETNALSTISLLTHLANYFEQRREGTIAVITSVAGDRGRQSNYLYGCSKAAVNVFLQGLRNRLHKSGVNVVTIKPGFVDTPMTASFEKGLLWVKPGTIARRLFGLVSGKSKEVYVPYYWSIIMRLIRLIPESVFKRMSL